jgi:hypothetical protein
MGRVPIPGRLHPELPWFRTLEAEPGYPALIGELRRRQAEARAGIAAIDRAAAGAAN